MAHGDTIVDGDRIELSRIAAHLLYLFAYDLSDLMQVRMAWYELGKRVDNGNDRLAKLLVLHTRSHPQSAGSGHSPALRTDGTP